MAYEAVGVELEAKDAAAYLNTLERIENAHQALYGGVRSVVDALNDLARESKTAAKSTEQIADAAKDSDKALDNVADAAQDAAKAADDLGDETKQGARGLDVLGEAAKGAARKLGEFALEGAQEAAEAVLQFAADTISAAGDFEAGMNSFSAVAGGALEESGQSLEEFKDLFISLGRDLPVSTAEVQQAAIEMAKGGIEPATIAAGGLKTALDLAGASGVGIAESAEILAKQLGVWVDSAATAEEKSRFLAQAANLMSQAANASTTDVQGLHMALSNAGGAAEQVGVNFNELVTTTALIAPAFNSTAEAGTALRYLFLNLNPKTAAAAEKMKELGLLTAEGTSKFYDASGAFLGMEHAADLLRDAFGGLSEAQKANAVHTIFGSEAISAVGILAEKGADGLREMAEDMAGVGTVAQQAAKRQQGWNVAVDNMMGSLEAFQITAGTALLPTLTSLVNLLASGINAITDYTEATIEGDTALAHIAGTVSTLAIPTLTGLTAALTAYAIVQAIQATPAILASIPALAAQTAAFAANALAVAAAAAPYAAIAIAIGAVMLKQQEYEQTLATATQQLLDSKPFWQASTIAIESFGAATGEARTQLEPLAGTIEVLRSQIEADIQALADHEAQYATFGEASGRTRAELDAEMQAINAKAAALEQATGAYVTQEQAINASVAAQITATSVTESQRDGLAGLGNQVSLTTGDIERLTEAIRKNAEDGQAAVQAYATTESEFLSGVEQRRQEHQAKLVELTQSGNADQIAAANEAYAAQEQAAAAAYAAEQAAQQAHLGQMLADYVVAQAQLGKIGPERALEMTRAIEEAYGIQQSSVASTYLAMTQTIDAASNDQSTSIASVIDTLKDQQQQAADTQIAMDKYAKEYVAEAVANFVEKGQEADDYAAALRAIPGKAHTAVTSSAAKAQDEVDEFSRHLDAVPRTIHVQVEVDIPDVVLPHSPTPFEMGLRGIADALTLVRSETNRLPSSLRALETALSPIGQELNNLPKDFHDVSKTAESTSNDIAEYMSNASKAIDALGESLSGIGGGVGDMGSAFDGFEAGFPAMLTPGSPSPLEIALLGIADAMGTISTEGKDAADALKEAFANIADSFSWAAAIPRAQEDMDAFIRELTSMEGLDPTFLFHGGAEGLAGLGKDAMAQFQQALADAEKLRGLGPEGAAQADRFLQERIQQIQELASLQRELMTTTDANRRSELETSIARISQAQQNELMALLASIPGIEALFGQIAGRAAGGPVSAGTPYWVGENRRRELFVPNQSGSIVPEDRLLRGIASLAQIAAFGQQQQTNVTYNQQRTLNMPVQMNSSPDVGMSIQIAQALI